MTTPEFLAAGSCSIRPCGLVISRVWRTGETNRNRSIICYELTDPDTAESLGVFHTPIKSRLAEQLIPYLQGNK